MVESNKAFETNKVVLWSGKCAGDSTGGPTPPLVFPTFGFPVSTFQAPPSAPDASKNPDPAVPPPADTPTSDLGAEDVPESELPPSGPAPDIAETAQSQVVPSIEPQASAVDQAAETAEDPGISIAY